MTDPARVRQFERLALPHLDAAYNLARWLTRSDHDAEDVVQEAFLRALTYFDSFKGDDARPWLLSIVRRTCFTWLEANRPRELVSGLDDDAIDALAPAPASDDSPEAALLREADVQLVNEMIERLPPEFREVLVLRELQECSYRDIAAIVGIPIGTVMSRLARARRLLQADAASRQRKDAANGL